MSESVFRHISSESNQYESLDKDVFESLLKFEESLKFAMPCRKGIKRCVQSVSIDLIVIHYWTENGVRLWHELVGT